MNRSNYSGCRWRAISSTRRLKKGHAKCMGGLDIRCGRIAPVWGRIPRTCRTGMDSA